MIKLPIFVYNSKLGSGGWYLYYGVTMTLIIVKKLSSSQEASGKRGEIFPHTRRKMAPSPCA